MTDKNDINPDDAQDALDSVEKMQSAGFRRALPPRWYGIGVSLIVTVGFAMYIQDDPGSTPGVFIALSIALFAALSREKMGVFGNEFPDTRLGLWAFAGVCVFLLALFFGGIYLKRAYDIAWMPVVTGLIAGITVFLLSESERRYYIARIDDSTL